MLCSRGKIPEWSLSWNVWFCNKGWFDVTMLKRPGQGNEQLAQLWKKPENPVSLYFVKFLIFLEWSLMSIIQILQSHFCIQWIWFQMNQCSYLYKLFSVFLVKVRSLTWKIVCCYKIHQQETCQGLNLNHIPVTW